MSRPIYEPRPQRDIASLGYGKRQLERRPAPLAAASGADPIWVRLTRTTDITMVSGALVMAFPDDGNNATQVSNNAAGEIDILPFTSGTDFLGVYVFEPSIITCEYSWSVSNANAGATVMRSNIEKVVISNNSVVGINRYEYTEITSGFLTVLSVVDTFFVTQQDIDDSDPNNYFHPRARQESGTNKNLTASDFQVWRLPLVDPAS
jgi:hypothetical protein